MQNELSGKHIRHSTTLLNDRKLVSPLQIFWTQNGPTPYTLRIRSTESLTEGLANPDRRLEAAQITLGTIGSTVGTCSPLPHKIYMYAT